MPASDIVPVGIALGTILAALGFGRKSKVDRDKALAEAVNLRAQGKSSAESATAALMEAAVTGAKTVLVMKDGELELLQGRLSDLETKLEEQAVLLAECQEHRVTIDRLRDEVDALRLDIVAERERADRYLVERNEARDQLRVVEAKLTAAEERLETLERRLDAD